MAESRRLLIVSNRLPFRAHVEGEEVVLTPSTGGVASGLRVLHNETDSLWIGWPGDLSSMPRRHRSTVRAHMRNHNIVPVSLTRGESQEYYDGFCNGILWPLLHYQIDRLPLGLHEWRTYRQVNERFAAAVAEHYRPGDRIWIHDFHLMLVPGLLRSYMPEAEIGFFLHVPFPAADIFRILPWRHEMLQGLLGASLIGFHTGGYASHFLDTVRSLTALEVDGCVIKGATRSVRVGVYPMGADVASFAHPAAAGPGVDVADAWAGMDARAGADAMAGMDARASVPGAPDQRILLGVDRLDYTKGIPRRLLAYERLLQNHPELRGRVRMIQLGVPSRVGVPSYERYREQVEELVSRINGGMGRVGWTPIEYLYQSVSPAQLASLYRAADVMLVTPLRDGMNLVAKEYVAARTDRDGVLVLSEFAGSAHELPEALTVNPYDIEEMAETFARALDMGVTERRQRMEAMRRTVLARDVRWWASTFMRDLAGASAIGAASAVGAQAVASIDRAAMAKACARPLERALGAPAPLEPGAVASKAIASRAGASRAIA